MKITLTKFLLISLAISASKLSYLILKGKLSNTMFLSMGWLAIVLAEKGV